MASRVSAASITSSESFQARAQRSEATKVVLWLCVLLSTLLLALLRRFLGGVVMSRDDLFHITLVILGVACAAQLVLLFALNRANRRSVLLPQALFLGVMIFDFCSVTSMFAALQWVARGNAIAALSAPVLLLFPLLILTSVLRLRPRSTLALGILAALVSWTLTVRALSLADADASQYPFHFSYGVALLMTGASGMLVANTMRKHVRDSIDEAIAREAADARSALMQRDLAVARDIQRGLLPASVPQLDGFELAGFNRAADLTGGDYYDWQLLPDGRLVAVLADVTGHGIGPALVMAVCRAYARASASVIDDPSALMVKINQLLQGDLPGDRFITFVVAMVRRDGEVRLLSAGHGPTLLYCAATGEVREFHGDGLPLGVDVDDPYMPAIELKMAPGDVLVMLTDGFFEWHRAGDEEQFGISRLVETLRVNAGETASEIIARLDGAVREFVMGSPQNDDMTAVVLKRLPQG